MRESKQQWEKVRDMQQLHGSERDSERHLDNIGDNENDAGNTWYLRGLPTTIRDIEKLAANLWDQRDSKRQPATLENSERHVETPWDWRDSDRQQATIRDS